MNFRTLHISCFLLCIGLLSCTDPKATDSEPVEQATEQRLLLTAKGAEVIHDREANSPVLSKAVESLRNHVKKAMQAPIEVPVPKDPGGGYTHEKHKANYLEALQTATLFLIDGDLPARDHCKELLLSYAAMYADLPIHPNSKKQAPGKLFWQILNEEVALVHFIQAYDAVGGSLTETEQQQIEEGLIRPMVTFIKEDNKETFNKIHNHAMWAVAGVGMSGFVLNDQELVQQALYGSDVSGNSGFFKQIESLFSPDGYYSEGPYYQRYALMPLVLLAQALEKNQPEKKVFAFRDSVVIKAIRTTVQMSACKGNFFPLNDAIKSKTIETPELGYALPVWYAFGGHNPHLVSLIKDNGNLMLTDALMDLDTDASAPFIRKSVVLSDGPKGDMGGIAVLREQGACTGLTAVVKYGTHGMGHGHFDQLGLLVYDQGEEILSDYGAARFLNIPQKEGGRYLTENKTWGQQTVAHNTLVVDGASQHLGDVATADAASPQQVFAQLDKEVQGVSVVDTSAYEGVTLQRVVALLQIEGIQGMLLDIYRVQSGAEHQYDLPFHYQGQRIAMNPIEGVSTDVLKPLGTENGYQHLWLHGTTKPVASSSFNLLNQDRFYTITSCSDQAYQVAQTTLGANDPQQNLRRESSFIYRSTAQNQIWVNVLEPHGWYNTVHEKTVQAHSQIKELTIQSHTEQALELTISMEDGRALTVQIDLSKELSGGTTKKPITLNIK